MQSKSTLYPMVGRVCLFSFFALFSGRERAAGHPPKAGQRSQTAETIRRMVWPAARCFGLKKPTKHHDQSGMVGTASGGMGQV